MGFLYSTNFGDLGPKLENYALFFRDDFDPL